VGFRLLPCSQLDCPLLNNLSWKILPKRERENKNLATSNTVIISPFVVEKKMEIMTTLCCKLLSWKENNKYCRSVPHIRSKAPSHHATNMLSSKIALTHYIA
jgi:hypothetical protein